MTEKKYLKKEIQSDINYVFEGSIESLIRCLRERQKNATDKGFINVEIDQVCRGYGDSETEYILVGEILETDSEFEKRTEKEEKAKERKKIVKANKKEKELKQLRKLQEKYPDEAKGK